MPICGGRAELDDTMLGGAGLLVFRLSGACMVTAGTVGVALEPELVEKAMLLDKKISTSCSCAAENESNFDSSFSNAGSRGSKWALSVCFSFPNGSMIV